jgi:flagellar basal-body rod modification protein FlgD
MVIAATTSVAAAGSKPQSTSSIAASFDSFLQLLTAQLAHQDPLSPLDATQFTNQLVQFSSVEQAIQTNNQLKQLTGLIESSSLTSALGFIGLDVAFSASQVQLGTEGNAAIEYSLPQAADEVAITIRDANGAVVHQGTGSVGAGGHGYSWDGRKLDGSRAGAGLYKIEIRANDAEGKALQVDRETQGRVEAIESDSDGLRLVIGGVPVPLEQVRTVSRMPAAVT